MSTMRSALADFIHLFYPHVCAGCGSDIIDIDRQLCLYCISQLPSTHFFNQPGNPVEKNFYGRLNVVNAASGYFFTKHSLIEAVIYELKYKGNKLIGFEMGERLGHLLANSRFNDIDIIIPLPLNAQRFKKRGYNQAEVLSEGIGSIWNKPVVANAVIRNVNTETQTHKGRISRWENMDGVFAVAEPSIIQDKHVLLVDDVVTTGASLEACGAEILKVSGAKISIATLAYTI
ncbi:phosphoribosyltransferase family protein [Segetibacter sp.]|jgi:ComF family protein|uniref:ComF family protein n=1 Tax=Segetibacter sp. TaxID=2231182 RepID=UPI0026161616|nr:phosphoribosyltransferase family protein [Segetibacter sp.]MCW3079118.1 ComF family protein [Segetibacter sp.]